MLAQQLITAGETVVDVPATLAARTRLLSSNRSHKNDPNDAMSVAITALRHEALRRVQPVGDSEQLRLLAKRNDDIGRQRSRVVSRLHALLVELVPGGIRREIYATASTSCSLESRPPRPVEQLRVELARELLDDLRRLDTQLRQSHQRLDRTVKASATTLDRSVRCRPGDRGDIDRQQR